MTRRLPASSTWSHAEAAAFLGCHEVTMRRAANKGDGLPCGNRVVYPIKVNGHWVWSADAIRGLMVAQEAVA